MIKEIKKEEILPLEAVKSKIWMLFDILRSENISSDDYHVVLFLLSAYKDNLISFYLVNENQHLKERLIEQLHNSKNEQSNQYAPIIQSFEPSIQRLSENGLRHLFFVLEDINKQVLTENFADVFDSVLYRISQSEGRYAGGFIQPLELTRFMCGLADLKKDAKVFNPFAGLASFGVYFDQGQDYFGQELNEKTWALGALRFMAYERPDSSKFVCDDSILHWPDQTEKFDLILSNPPYGMRLEEQYRHFNPSVSTIEQFLIEKGVQSLKQNGKLIALLPQGLLFRGMKEQRLRELLIEEDLIETIISLTGGLLLNTGIPLTILVISKNKKLPGKVKFVDAKKFVIAKGPREKVLDDYSLSSFIHSDKKDDNVVRIVSNEQIRDNNYNLSVARYFRKQIDGVKLGDILELVRGQRSNLPETGKLIRIRNLKDDKVDFTLDVTSVEETELRRPNIHLVSESCLLLALHWRTLKPTLFEFNGEPIFSGPEILSFKVNESRADKAYLINELHADYVQEQLESYRLGFSVMPYIRRDDLMEVIIKLPSLEEQRAKVQGIYELSDKIKRLQEEIDALAHGETIKQFNEFASLKHTLGTPRQNILSYSEALISFFEKNPSSESEKVSVAFKEKMGVDLNTAFQAIKHDINFISELLEKGENGLILKDYDLSLVPLSQILKYIQQFCTNHNYNFLSIPPSNIHDMAKKEAESLGIRMNFSLLKILFDNIFSNAYKYAFEKRQFSTAQMVIVELGITDEGFFINILNNGKPFPKNMDKEKFISKFKTSDANNGTGLGGYDINRILEYFECDWFLRLNTDPLFPVQFNFWFKPLPIK